MTIEGFNNPKVQPNNQGSSLENNSGQGANSRVLDIVAKKFNWGAFLLTWIWGLGNRSFITLIIFPLSFLGMIPLVGWIIPLACNIWFGIKGNEWAWQNKRWESIEQFHEVQKKWVIGGLIATFVLWALLIVGIGLTLILPSMLGSTNTAQNRATVLKSVTVLEQATEINKALDIKCRPTSEGLANCFAQRANVTSQTGSTVETVDGVLWMFTGDGICNYGGDCEVSISNDKGLYETIPLYLEDGYLKVDAQDLIDKYQEE